MPFFISTGLRLEFLVVCVPWHDLWEHKTEKARLARSNGPDLYHNYVHVMIFPS